jgi:hypothetical protein
MTFTLRASDQPVVVIGATTYELAQVDDVTEGIAPEIGSATIRLPMGRAIKGTTITTTDPSVTMRDDVTITIGSYVWTGEVATIEEIGQGQVGASVGSRWMVVGCQGLASQLERAYLGTWREISVNTGLAISVNAPRDLNENMDPDRSAAMSTISGRSVYVSDYYATARALWDQSKAVNSILAIGQADSGLPNILLDDPGGLLVRKSTWAIQGRSVHAAIGEIIGSRSDVWWQHVKVAGQQKIKVRAAYGSGSTIDLTTPFIADYSYKKDGKATLLSAKAVGSRPIYIETLIHYPLSTGGDFERDWTNADVTRWEAGDDNSPAYRKFRVDPTFALPDGSYAGNGRVLSNIPCIITDLSGPTVLGGPGYSSQIQVFFRDGPTGTWQSLAGRVSAHVSSDGATIWCDGHDWINLYKAAQTDDGRFAFTVAIESGTNMTAPLASGAGVQKGYLSLPAQHVRMPTGTYIGVNSAGTIVTYGATFRDDQADLQLMADAWWNAYKSDRSYLTWSEWGVAGTSPDPGTIISSATIPRNDGGSASVAINTVVTRRTVRWTPNGVMTTWTTAPLEPNLNGMQGKA